MPRRSSAAHKVLLAGLLASLACAGGPGVGDPNAADGPRLYVASQTAVSVAVFDMTSGRHLETVDLTALGYSPTAKAHHVAVEPDGSYWYVSLIADGKILKLDRDNRVVAEADFETPGMLALDPGSDLLYVGRSMAAVNPPHRIGMIHRSTMALEEIDVFFPRPHALTIDQAGGSVYTSSLGENRLAVVPLGEEEASLSDIPGPHHMMVQLAVSPDGRWMVGGGQMSGELVVWELTDAGPALHTRLAVGGQPWHPSFSPDGSELWVPQQEAGTVSVVRTTDWSVAGVVEHPGLAEPHGSAISPDGRLVFVSGHNVKSGYGGGGDGTVVVIERASRRVLDVVLVGAYAAGMAGPAGPAAVARRR